MSYTSELSIARQPNHTKSLQCGYFVDPWARLHYDAVPFFDVVRRVPPCCQALYEKEQQSAALQKSLVLAKVWTDLGRAALDWGMVGIKPRAAFKTAGKLILFKSLRHSAGASGG